MKHLFLLPCCFLALSAAAQSPARTLLQRLSYTLVDGCYQPRYEGEDSVATELSYRNADSTVTKELRAVKSNRLIRREIYLGKKPVGTWLLQYDSTKAPLEFAYALSPKGILSSCESGYLYQLGDPELSFGGQGQSFSPPELQGGQSIAEFISARLHYPKCAEANLRQGEVRVNGILTETGMLQHLVISKSLAPELDAEVMRVMKLLQFAKPALLDGKPISLCVRLPVTFSE